MAREGAMRAGSRAVAAVVALCCAGCASHGKPELRGVGLAAPTPEAVAQFDAPDHALSRQALDLRALSAGQALALARQLRHCLAQDDAATGLRACAFRQLAHSAVSQRLNAGIAVALIRRLRGGDCRASLLTLASLAALLAGHSDGVLRELNGMPTVTRTEHRRLLALDALARDVAASLDERAWRRHCAAVSPASGAAGHSGIGQLVE
jgi:hypothetical protein